jgi:hypothetical protein
MHASNMVYVLSVVCAFNMIQHFLSRELWSRLIQKKYNRLVD